MNQITIEQLKQMTHSEGLLLQGCGGDLQAWVDGVNDMLTEEDILLEGDTFKHVSAFQHDGTTNLLFHFDDVKLDVGKLAMWRLRMRQQFAAMWLSDYLPLRLGIEYSQQTAPEKPSCPLIGANSNVFHLMGLASRTLKDAGMLDAASEMKTRITESGSYDSALSIIMEYVTPVSAEEYQSEDFDMCAQ